MIQKIKEFEYYLISEEKSDATVMKYTHDVKMFIQWLSGQEITKAAVQEYKQCLESEYAPKSVNSKLSSLNSFFEWADHPEFKVKSLKIQQNTFIEPNRELTKSLLIIHANRDIINENGEGGTPLRFALQEQQQAQRDNRHTDYDAYDSDFAFFVLARHREQLFERYEHHNSRDRAEQYAENRVVKERAQQQIPDNRAERFGDAREKRHPKRLAPAARRIVNRHRGRDAFGYIVYCYGDRNSYSEVRIL